MMSIEEAIKHAREVAEKREDLCEDCRSEHLQLALWLEELKSYKDKIEQGTLVDTEAYFIVEENQWAGKNKFLVCQNAIQLAVCDFCETREEAEKLLKELQK